MIIQWKWEIDLGTRSDRQSAWWIMDRGSWHCTGDRDQDYPQEKEMQKSKMAAWGVLTNSCEKKRSKKQREKERYTHLNVEFQRIVRRDKKAFLSDQCKEIEENNRIGNTRYILKKIRDTKGTFHAKMGSIKDRNGHLEPDILECQVKWALWRSLRRKPVEVVEFQLGCFKS